MRQDLHVETDLDALTDRPRFRRYGQLAPQLGIPAGQQVRAECTGCGTHLLAVPHEGGRLSGTCPVCLGHSVTAVAGHHATA